MINKNWRVIVNPNAGSGKGERDWEVISQMLSNNGFNFDPVFTTKIGDAAIYANNSIQEKYCNFIVIGGDGTLNETINGILKAKNYFAGEIYVGMITVGTGNDWGRMFGIPMNYAEAIRTIKRKCTIRQDVGVVHYFENKLPKSRYFVNIAGMGFDAEVAKHTNVLKQKGKRGSLLYVYSLIRCLLNYRSVRTQIKVDEVDLHTDVFSLSVGIGKFNGGGMEQLPNAIPDDGLFDLTIINKMNKLEIVRSMRRLYNGTLLEHPKVSSFTGKTVDILAANNFRLEADGETLGEPPYRFEILEKHLNVIVGNDWCRN